MNINVSYNNYNQNAITQKPAFKGVIGDKLVKEIVKAEDTIELKSMMNEVKGIMGPNKSKVTDVVESFVGKIKELQEVLPSKDKKMRELQIEMNNIPSETTVNYKKTEEVYEQYSEQRAQMKDRANDVENRLKFAQKEAELYEPMKEVKSIEDLDIIMPEKLKEIIDETNENKNKSAGSMLNFLMNNGNGKDALAQVNRFKLLTKSFRDGMFRIPEISEHADNKYAPAGDVIDATINLISMALKGSPKGIYLESNSTKTNVKNKALSFLKPLYEDYEYYDEAFLTTKLNKTLDNATDFHRNFQKGKSFLIKNNADSEMFDVSGGYDTAKSYLEFIDDNGKSKKLSYNEVSNIGCVH